MCAQKGSLFFLFPSLEEGPLSLLLQQRRLLLLPEERKGPSLETCQHLCRIFKEKEEEESHTSRERHNNQLQSFRQERKGRELKKCGCREKEFPSPHRISPLLSPSFLHLHSWYVRTSSREGGICACACMYREVEKSQQAFYNCERSFKYLTETILCTTIWRD